jgi:glycyl-tRNA synthetase beta chain
VPALLDAGFAAFPEGLLTHATARADLLHFMVDRLVGSLREQGYSAQEVDAVVALRPRAVGEHPQAPGGGARLCRAARGRPLAAANKRVANILKKSDAGGASRWTSALLVEPAELRWRRRWPGGAQGRPAVRRRRLHRPLQALAGLKAPVDAFFDGVMVNADDAGLRANRLALLRGLHAPMNRVADLARLAS